MMFLHKLLHLFVGPAFRIDFAVGEIDNQVVGPVTGLAHLAVHQRIGEAGQMPGSLPHPRIHQDRCLDLHIVRVFLDEFLLPGTLDMILEHHTVRAEIPCVA